MASTEASQTDAGFCGICQFGSLGHEEFERSVRLFADRVIPALSGVR